MIYYSSDLHFNHKNILDSCERPYKDLEDMNNQLVSNWNNTLTDEDEIYFLGDFSYSKNNKQAKEIIEIVQKLNGKKHLILGNHDSILMKFEEFKELFESIDIYKKINDEGRYVILMHYPLEVWERSHYGSYHLHGHIHKKEINFIKNRFNVGVDVNSYKPVTLTDLVNNPELNGFQYLLNVTQEELNIVEIKLKQEGFKFMSIKTDYAVYPYELYSYLENINEVRWFVKGILNRGFN